MPCRASFLFVCLALMGCETVAPGGPASPPKPDASLAGPLEATPQTTAQAAPTEAESLRASEGVLHVEAREFTVGSLPGVRGRDPQREAALVPVALSAFDIEVAPAQDEGRRRVVRSQGEADHACRERGRRLCTELEWEQGCKLGAEAFTWHGPEWTASAGGPSFGDAPTVVVRGGTVNAEHPSCAARRALTADAAPRGVGFRCCGGDTNEATYPSPTRGRAFRALNVDEGRVRAVLSEIPELARYATDFRLFHASDAERALRRCAGSEADLHGWQLVDGVLEWAPGWGPANWVFAGRSGDDAMVIVLHRVGSAFVHGSSFINAGDPAPIAITFTPPSRDTLRFDASVGCVAEGGVIAAETDGRVMTYHRRVGW